MSGGTTGRHPGRQAERAADETVVQVPGASRRARPAGDTAAGELEEGSAVAHYRILERLGSGAMGSVYKAADTRLKRTVALKLLRGEPTRDPVAKARFLQEAQAASALDHPNVCTIHEVGETPDGQLYLAMAAYDGETVKARIARGRLPVALAVDIAFQAAQGLAKAHREGIVHRDVKPANLLITRDGRVKILDFGVAKLRGAAGMNVAGSFLGTPAYMSPEQARGEEVDARSDVFSLGVVLHEMLAGTHPFRTGESVSSTIRSLLEDRPVPLRSLRPEVPPELERVVTKMLAKPRAERSTAAEVLADLASIQRALAETPPRARGRRVWLGAAAALVPVLALGAWLALRPRSRPPVQPVFTRLTEQEGRESHPSLAPDGLSFAYTKSVNGQKDIFLQKLDGSASVNLTEGSAADDDQPAVSPDGRWVAFRSERGGGGIYIVSIEGGHARRLSDLGNSPAWSPDGRELAVATEGIADPTVRKADSEIWRIDVATGRRRLLVGADAVQPSWSPGGRRIAYWGLPRDGAQRVLWTVATDSAGPGTPLKLLDDGHLNWNPVWSPDGRWLYFGSDRSGSLNLWRLPIDEKTGKARGEPQPVTTPATTSGFWSLSRDGDRILYAANESRSIVERFPFDPGRLQVAGSARAVTRGSQMVRSCDVSPDGQWIAFHASLPRDELFVLRADGSGLRQLTDDPYRDRQPFWSPDGRRLLFYSDRRGSYEAWILGIDPGGGGAPEPVLPPGGPQATFPVWSPDGRRIAFTYGNEAAVVDLAQPLAARRARPLPPAKDLGESFYPSSWSPGGEHLAGNLARLDGSLQEGIGLFSLRSQLYVRLTNRGVNPVWLSDGRRLLYSDAGRILAFDTVTNEAREVLAPPPHSAYSAPSAGPGDHTLFAVRAIDEGDIWLLALKGG